MKEESCGPLAGPKVEPLTDAEIAIWRSVELASPGDDTEWPTTFARALATISDRDTKFAALVEALNAAHKALQQAYGSPRLARLDPPARTQLQTASWNIANVCANIPASAKALLERLEKSERENTILRGICSKIMPCHYCGVDEIGKCPHGFPGCSLADDVFIAEEEIRTTVCKERARAEAAEARERALMSERDAANRGRAEWFEKCQAAEAKLSELGK